jgi:NAD(P)H-dependent FMN reductase
MLLICTASHGHNLALARRIELLAQARGIDTHLLDLTTLDWPLYTSREALRPTNLAATENHFQQASAFFFVAPEYNGSVPPALNNALAWLSTQSDNFRALFNGKACAMATHSGGGGQKVLVAMRLQLSHLGLHVVGREILTNPKKPLRDDSVDALLDQIQKLEASL